MRRKRWSGCSSFPVAAEGGQIQIQIQILTASAGHCGNPEPESSQLQFSSLGPSGTDRT